MKSVSLAEIPHHTFEIGIGKLGVDLCSRNLPVAKGPLDKSQVLCLLVEPSCKRVTKCVDGAATRDSCVLKPVSQPQFHLPGADPPIVEGTEQRVCDISARRQITLQQSPEPAIQEHQPLDIPLPVDSNGAGAEINVADVESDE